VKVKFKLQLELTPKQFAALDAKLRSGYVSASLGEGQQDIDANQAIREVVAQMQRQFKEDA